ncbi:MAG: exonuclease domain-containing protein [Acholeplasmataceae bacterium]|jgi:sporulation inhibitor KapD|nr:exonuclease domain-containing protein [Acholeplasmataceae bacterium]
MKKIIHSIDYKHAIFYLIIEGQKVGFYLSNRLSKIFFQYLSPGVLVDFEIQPKMKKVINRFIYQVAYFNQIIRLNPYQVHYDLYQLRREMKDVLVQDRYYLFIDFEMTMPGYRPEEFKPEIIQVGYVLSKVKTNAILQDGYYVLPKEARTLSKRTKKFLHLDEEAFFNDAKPYDFFYENLRHIMETYQPKLVVWGKNDLVALSDSFTLHDKERIIDNHDFIDLLKLHKDYFNLRDDLGLFKAYQTYYDVTFDQAHDAKDDAFVTKLVFDAFLSYM